MKKWFRFILLCVAVVSTVLTLTDHIEILGGDGRPAALFFTSWTAWIATLSAIVFCFSKNPDSKCYALKFSANIMVIATFVVAAFVLPEKIWTSDYWTLGGIFKHFILPVLTVIDTFLFDEKGKYKISFPFIGVIFPVIYWTSVIVRVLVHKSKNSGIIPESEWNNYYPYGFTNLDNGHSLVGLCSLLGGILVALILVGFGLYFYNRHRK